MKRTETMNRIFWCACLLFAVLPAWCVAGTPQGEFPQIKVLWREAEVSGTVQVRCGELEGVRLLGSRSAFRGGRFRTSARCPGIEIRFAAARTAPGPEPTLVTVRTRDHVFSFLLRDVSARCPIYLPDDGVVVLPADDDRSYGQVEREILDRGLENKLRRIERDGEASFDKVARNTRKMSVPVWLGLGRDIRLFEISEELEDTPNEEKVVRPTLSSSAFGLPETGGQPIFYRYALGRGVGARNNIRRRLERGVLPIYRSELCDDDVVYRSVSFAVLERSELDSASVAGTHCMISDSYSPGRVFTDDQLRQLERVRAGFVLPDEEPVLYCRTVIRNTGRVPRYAWVKTPAPGVGVTGAFDPATGFSSYSPDRVFCLATWNGRPLPNEELGVLLQPGDSASFEFRMPHSPIPRERALQLAARSFDEAFADCRAWWSGKLAAAARIVLPERRIDEMVRAGLLHLDLNTFGQEPDGPLAAKAGIYSPIGTESAPIIQFYCSMGLFEQARRSLDYFIATQQADGRIMNYYGYTIETGAVLWCVGEYFRYTHDGAWIERIRPQLLRACDFLADWRARDGADGSGMISGKVADPEDRYHQFMLNAYGYLGMSRMAETMRSLGYPEAERLQAEAEAWREAIRRAALQAMETSPLVPMGDGTWSRTLPPWTEAPGPRLLYQRAEKFRSHGTFTAPDAGLGPVYLVFGEVFGPDEPLSRTVMGYVAELMCQGNTGFSQPYYGRLNWWLAATGRVKPFLDAYYTAVSAHADRETYGFWEHFFRLSPHKTHEEAGFLMETRWMLYREQGDTLHLLRAVPRAWLAEGKRIELQGVRSYFGAVDLLVERTAGNRIEATVVCEDPRRPRCVTVRLPHPEERRPVRVAGGRYLSASETVVIDAFDGRASVSLEFE